VVRRRLGGDCNRKPRGLRGERQEQGNIARRFRKWRLPAAEQSGLVVTWCPPSGPFTCDNAIGEGDGYCSGEELLATGDMWGVVGSAQPAPTSWTAKPKWIKPMIQVSFTDCAGISLLRETRRGSTRYLGSSRYGCASFMYDTVVVALIYRLEHENSVEYRSAEAVDYEEPGFWIRIEDKEVRFEFKEQHATEQEAREAIQEYIREWEFEAGLRHGPGSFGLSFLRSEIKYRNAPPGTLGPINIRSGMPRVTARLTVGLPRYPKPPSGVTITPDVKSMYDRYVGYRRGKEPLASMAYFCLTVVEQSIGHKSGKRREAAKQYQISQGILDEIGKLSSGKGGPDARKADGRTAPLTAQERRFLEKAIKALIRRAAQKAHSPAGDYPLITKSNLQP